MPTVDPDSDEARRRREELGEVSPTGRRARRYAVASLVPLLTLVALFATAPELAASYGTFVVVVIASPFVLMIVVGMLTDGDFIPNPFVLHPITSIVIATLVFLALAIFAPGLLEAIGGMAVGVVVTVLIAVGVLAWIAGLFT